MSGDFGFDAERGRGAPTREVRHERTRFEIGIYLNRSDVSLRSLDDLFRRVHRYGAGRNRIIDLAERHSDRTRNVVINHASRCAGIHRVADFFLESYIASLYKRNSSVVPVGIFDFSSYSLSVVRRSAYAAYNDVFKIKGFPFRFAGNPIQLIDEIEFVAVAVGSLGDERNLIFRSVRLNVSRLLTVYRSDG